MKLTDLQRQGRLINTDAAENAPGYLGVSVRTLTEGLNKLAESIIDDIKDQSAEVRQDIFRRHDREVIERVQALRQLVDRLGAEIPFYKNKFKAAVEEERRG
jgi:hypothetical protein